jgi:hypothetical protein
MWGKTRKVIGGLVIICFFLPFFGVSCDGMDVVTISGADMVGGCKPGGLASEADDEDDKSSRNGGGGGGITAKVEKVDIEPLAIAALALALIAFGLTWLGTRQTLIASLAVSVAAIGVLIGLYISGMGKLDDMIADSKKDKGENVMTRDVKIEAGPRMGLYGAWAGFLALAVFSGLALRPREVVPGARVVREGGPPPGPPPDMSGPPPSMPA